MHVQNHLIAKLCCNGLRSFFNFVAILPVLLHMYYTVQVLRNNSLQNKLENIDTQTLVQQYFQLQANIKVKVVIKSTVNTYLYLMINHR